MLHDPHGHGVTSGSHAAHGPEGHLNSDAAQVKSEKSSQDIESFGEGSEASAADAITQMIGVAILEFGVLLHSILIGLTLAVDPDFIVLFVVIIFHQTFEGLGVGTRLAQLKLRKEYNWLPILGAVLYGITTPLGIAVGLGVKSTYNPNSTTASIVSGILDSLSSGILIYTGLVELLAHEFLFNKDMVNWSNGKLAFALCSMLAGCGIMSLLGRWA
jgi:zinc transporter 1/2/3